MKRFLAIILVIALVAALAACSGGDTPTEGYRSSTEAMSGGDESVNTDVNLKSITVTDKGEATEVIMYLLSGSVLTGKEESKLVKLPKYEISFLQSPARMRVRFYNIDYYDYSFDGGEQSSGLVLGMFKVPWMEQNYLDVYFELSADVQYNVVEEADQLKIYLKKEKDIAKAYYTVTNSFMNFQEGNLPEELNYTPVLCSDMENVMMISQPFATQEEAQAHQAKTQEQISDASGRTVNVIELSGDQLPELVSEVDVDAIINAPSAKVGEQTLVLDAILKNGHFLDVGPNDSLLFSRTYSMDEATEEDVAPPIYDRLWTKAGEDNVGQLPLPAFQRVTKAQYSPSGRFIAILELGDENTILYVYDTQTKELLNLSEEGLGNMTDDFCFDETSDVIYSISGTDNQKQLMKVDLTGAERISAVEEQATQASKIQVKNGKLYVADVDQSGAGYIYEVTAEGRRQIAAGVDFSLSGDGNTMAVLTMNASEEAGEAVDLTICYLTTGSTKTVQSNLQILEMGYLGNTLYLTTNLEEETDSFLYQLYRYDAGADQPVEEAQLKTGEFYPEGQNSLYLLYYVSGPDQAMDFYITFQYPVQKSE